MISPSGRVPEQGSRWYFEGTEACGGVVQNLGLFLGGSLFIRFFGVQIMRRWAKMGPRGTTVPYSPWHALVPRGHLVALLVLPRSFLVLFCSKKNCQQVSLHLENFYFCTKNNTTVVLLKTASVRVSSNQIIPKPYRIVINMA